MCYLPPHTHVCTHNDCSRNWVLILVGMEILWEEEGFSLALKHERVEQCLKILREWIPNVGSKAREGVKATSLCVVGFSACRCQKNPHLFLWFFSFFFKYICHSATNFFLGYSVIIYEYIVWCAFPPVSLIESVLQVKICHLTFMQYIFMGNDAATDLYIFVHLLFM